MNYGFIFLDGTVQSTSKMVNSCSFQDNPYIITVFSRELYYKLLETIQGFSDDDMLLCTFSITNQVGWGLETPVSSPKKVLLKASLVIYKNVNITGYLWLNNQN